MVHVVVFPRHNVVLCTSLLGLETLLIGCLGLNGCQRECKCHSVQSSAALLQAFTCGNALKGTKQLSVKPETLLVVRSFTPLHYLIFLPVPLCRKAATHNSEIRHLYEEMEAQIKNEKDRLLLKVEEHKQTLQNDVCAESGR